MVLYLLSNSKKIGGVFQWEQSLQFCTVIYNVNQDFESGDEIYVNNYVMNDFFNDSFLTKLCNINVKLFFVIHSDLCPINKLFVTFNKYFSGVISTNECVKQKINLLFPDIENIYIPNISSIDNNVRHQITNKKQINYVGRLSPEKNLPMLLCAIRSINDIMLVLYGDIDVRYYKYLLNLCNLLKIQHKVKFMGLNNNKEELYKNASCVILPSVHEGLPYCLLEAESYSIPVIYNDISMIHLHLTNEANIRYTYTYEGCQNLSTMLYIENYSILLKAIGYVEFVIDIKSKINFLKIKNDLKTSTLLSLIEHYTDNVKVGDKFMVPPFLMNNTNENNLFELNVSTIEKAIKNFFDS